VVNEEALKTSAVISELANSVKHTVDDLFTDGVMTTGVVVGCVFLSGDQLFRMVQLSVGSGADLVNDGWFKIDVDTSWNVLASASLREKGVESIVTSSDGFVGRHLSVRLDSVLKAEKFPCCITDLATSLSNMNVNNFTHCLRVFCFSG
jgi:hypothetical protein